MKKLKLIGLFMLMGVLVMPVLLLSGCGGNGNGKIPDPGGEFSYDNITVLMTEDVSDVNRVWDVSDFTEFPFYKVSNIGLIGTRNFLALYLVEPSRENVLRAVYVMRQRSDVQYAELNGIDTIF